MTNPDLNPPRPNPLSFGLAIILLSLGLGHTTITLGQTSVAVSPLPPRAPVTKVFDYDASGNVTYIGTALAIQPREERFTRTACVGCFGLTSIAVTTNVATATTVQNHGLLPKMKIVVRNATVDTDLNGTYQIATVPSATTFTFATSSVADATYTEATLEFATSAPRTSRPMWQIKCFNLGTTGGASGQVVAIMNNSGEWLKQVWDNRTSLPCQ